MTTDSTSKKKENAKWFTGVNIIAAILRTFATGLAIFSLFTLMGLAWPISIATIGSVGLAYCFKEYASTQSSHKNVNVVDQVKLTPKQHLQRLFTLFIATLNGIGIESLFVAVMVSTAVFTLAPLSIPLAIFAIAAAAVAAIFTLPNDIIYYFNCIRKYFDLPEKIIAGDVEHTKSDRRQFNYILASNFTGSFLVFGGILSTFVTAGALLGPIGMIAGAAVGLVVALIGGYANYLLLIETYHQVSKKFESMARASSFIEKISTFRDERRALMVKKITAMTSGLASAVPLVQAFVQSSLIQSGGLIAVISFAALTVICAGYSAYKFLDNYIGKLFNRKAGYQVLLDEDYDSSSSTNKQGDTLDSRPLPNHDMKTDQAPQTEVSSTASPVVHAYTRNRLSGESRQETGIDIHEPEITATDTRLKHPTSPRRGGGVGWVSNSPG